MKIPVETTKIGRIMAFDHDRGFGFISNQEDYKEYFVHVSRILTGQINQDDFVLFDLAPSRKKPGTMEAINVKLVSEAGDTPDILIDSYFKIDEEEFRQQVFRALPINKAISIIEKEIAAFPVIETQAQVSEFMGLHFRLQKSIVNQTFKDGSKKILSQWAQKVSRDSGIIEFWIRGVLDITPAESLIENTFDESDLILKGKIFSKGSEELKSKLVYGMIEKNSVMEVLNFLGGHVRNLNSLDYISFERKLREPDYWLGRPGYPLLKSVLDHYSKTLQGEDLLQPCIAGYPLIFPEKYVLENAISLPKDTIAKIISKDLINPGNKNQFYKSLLVSVTSSDESDELVNMLYKQIKGLSADDFLLFDRMAAELIPEEKYFSLWQLGESKVQPRKALQGFFQSCPPDQLSETWIRRGILTSKDIISINLDTLKSCRSINARKGFYSLHNCLNYLRKYQVSPEEMRQSSDSSISIFYQLSTWLAAQDELNYSLLKPYFLFLSHEHQVLFLKGLFNLHHRNKIKLTVDDLKSLLNVQSPELEANELAINVSIDVIVKAVDNLKRNQTFLVDYDLIAIALKNLSSNKTFKLQLGELFEKCPGRTEAEYDWKRFGEITKVNFGNNGQFYFAVAIPTKIKTWGRLRGERWESNPKFDESLEAVKKIPGRKYNAQAEHWGVPSAQEDAVLAFAKEKRFFLNFDGSPYVNNPHLAEMKLVDVPSGIIYCEGRLANQLHQTFQKEFWWCCNQPCFRNCETIHSPEQWKEYSFLDFLLMCGFQLDDSNSVGDYIEKGKYYQFISSINRFNRLLKRMYCMECNQILHPVEDSNFAHHRVVRFCCQNNTCGEHKKEVYLHHCMNGKCNGIIDSRMSKKCPNGLYICSNDHCGSCCSNDMFQRRADNLKTTRGIISDGLLKMIQTKAGHTDKDERFCFRCGQKMTCSDDIYNCSGCGTRYDVTSTKPLKKINRSTKHDQSDGDLDF